METKTIKLPVSGQTIIFNENEFLKKITAPMEAELKDLVQGFVEVDPITNKPVITDMKGLIAAQRTQRNKLIQLAFPDITKEWDKLALKDLLVLEEAVKECDPTGDEKFVKSQERNKMLAAQFGEHILTWPEAGLEKLAKKIKPIDEMTDDEIVEYVAKLGQVKTDPKA